MANYKVSDTELTSVANAIRTKGGTSASLSFPDGFVTAIGNISGGGSATLITKSITDNGTYYAEDDDADGYSSVTVSVSGGSSNFVTGTFTGQASEKGSAKSIIVPYSGSGYPLSLAIYPTAGAYKSGTDIYTVVQYKAIVQYFASKCDVSLTPDYTNNDIQNQFMVTGAFKGSSSVSDTYSSPSISKNYATCYKNIANGSGLNNVAKFYNSGTNLSVYIAPDDGTEYGFLAGTEYTYVIVYSS